MSIDISALMLLLLSLLGFDGTDPGDGPAVVDAPVDK